MRGLCRKAIKWGAKISNLIKRLAFGGVVSNNMKGVDAACGLLEKINRTGMSYAQSIRFSRENPAQVYPMALYGSILEFAHGIQTLGINRRFIGITVLLRAALEAHVDFVNCLSDHQYYNHIHANYLKEQMRLLNNAEKYPRLSAIMNQPDYESRRREVEEELQGYRAQGFSPLKAWERFERAQLKDDYASTYWLLSHESHSNLFALNDRHIKVCGDSIEVVFFSDAVIPDTMKHLVVSIALIIEATSRLADYFQMEDKRELDKLLGQFEELQKLFPPG